LAAQFGLKGKNNLESALIDEVVDTIEDVINVTIKTHFETDPVKKAETVSQLNESAVVPMLTNIEKRLVSRGGQFLVGNALSLADIHLFFFCSEYTTPKLLANTPKIANLVKRVEGLPNIQKWLKNRPISKL
jgi:glutathione S-transferase